MITSLKVKKLLTIGNESYKITEDNFRLICYTSCGCECLDVTLPNKSEALRTARDMKRHRYCFSYVIFGQTYDKGGKSYRMMVKQG